MAAIIPSLKTYFNGPVIPLAVGKSFLFSAAAVFILSSGSTHAALIAGGACAVVTFTACVLKDITLSILGWDKNQSIDPFRNAFMNTAVAGMAIVVAQVAFGVIAQPLYVVIGCTFGLIASVTVLKNSRPNAGTPIVIMHPVGLVGSYLLANF